MESWGSRMVRLWVCDGFLSLEMVEMDWGGM